MEKQILGVPEKELHAALDEYMVWLDDEYDKPYWPVKYK
jgi:hypothetical protein